MELGRFGIWTSYRAIGEENAGQAARLVEDLGFGAVWLGGSPQLPALAPMLEATERIVAATGILNVWQSDPAQTAARLRRSWTSGSPDASCSASASATPRPRANTPSPSRPCASFSTGSTPPRRRFPGRRAAWPRWVPGCSSSALSARWAPTRTSSASATRGGRASSLGPEPLLAPELACVLDENVASARATARAYAKMYLGLSNYTRALRRARVLRGRYRRRWLGPVDR